MSDFKAFLLRGNVVDLAVAVVIGLAFAALVTAFVADLVTPLIAAIGGQPDFSSLSFEINKSTFMYGDFLNKAISFVIISAVIFFCVVVPLNAMVARAKNNEPEDPSVRKCPECLSEIPAPATRCAYCTAVLQPTAQTG
ncbi:MAG: large conductance mechanosensitive channel protein MscL [Actinobacteria bacterium]|nr:large conductance mechanosensitive channel protein MscL [Actinomycetota bacterium]